ncbi:hypothetical protein FH608_041210 [Nonomuraea phyllanthi]|uniref:non-specific serine/threonine protein kinase n=1 Tax=Nonomuraea phyllanthi TaxID=2219224 RepID=A0A5C4VJ07_9ACTN|nr:hypothetical protein FH608_041210 [Nonomuraea phyllanthi]
MKVLKGGADPGTRRRLARELESARRAVPFCTARVLEAEPDQATPYVVSGFAAGPSLQDRVRAEGPLRHGDLDRLAVGTACALAAIHAAGVVHRDFKPASAAGSRRATCGRTSASPGRSTPIPRPRPWWVAGPPYMAPGQLKGEHGSPAADVFARAATMVYAATGRAPFGDNTVAAVFNRILTQEPDLSGIPESLRGTLAACLSKEPRGRPSSRALLIGLVGPGDPTVAVPDVGPVPSVYVPPNWTGSTRVFPPEPGPRTVVRVINRRRRVPRRRPGRSCLPCRAGRTRGATAPAPAAWSARRCGRWSSAARCHRSWRTR